MIWTLLIITILILTLVAAYYALQTHLWRRGSINVIGQARRAARYTGGIYYLQPYDTPYPKYAKAYGRLFSTHGTWGVLRMLKLEFGPWEVRARDLRGNEVSLVYTDLHSGVSMRLTVNGEEAGITFVEIQSNRTDFKWAEQMLKLKSNSSDQFETKQPVDGIEKIFGHAKDPSTMIFELNGAASRSTITRLTTQITELEFPKATA